MIRKIFIGIELPFYIKKTLERKIARWEDLPVLWTEKDNLHITLLFLGFVNEENILEICRQTQAVAMETTLFDIDFDFIIAEPMPTKNNKIIQLVGQPNVDLKRLQENLEKRFFSRVERKKEFRPHITLGRIKRKKWLALKEIPVIKEKMKMSVPVENIVVYESVSEKGKRKYWPLNSTPLKT